jgi:Ras of Complex, Roc, domain of DAPkinase/TIR domain
MQENKGGFWDWLRKSVTASDVTKISDAPSLMTGIATDSIPQRVVSDTDLPKLHCFISYSRRDGLRYAEALARILNQHNVRSFRDVEQLNIGDNFAQIIRHELQLVDVVILLATPDALRSEWVLTETRFFLERRPEGRLLPIVFEDDPETLPSFLQHIQYLKEDTNALDDGPSDRALEALLRALQLIAPAGPQLERPARPKNVESLPLNEGKLILVGRGEVGKTSVVKRLVSNQFRGDESKTQGINITNWYVHSNLETLRFNVWDFGGQEIMHATHQFFLTERSLYLLVLNGREGGEDLDAEYWLKHIESFGGI